MVQIIRRDFWIEVNVDGCLVFKGENITTLGLVKCLNLEDCPPNLLEIDNPFQFLETLNIDFHFRWDVQN
jgi:hypothetical protein